MPVCVSTAHAHHAGGMSSKQRAVAQGEKQEVCGVHAHGVLSDGDGSSHAETLMDAGRLREGWRSGHDSPPVSDDDTSSSPWSRHLPATIVPFSNQCCDVKLERDYKAAAIEPLSTPCQRDPSQRVKH